MANRSAPCSGLRSILIPEGVLDGTRDNVIYIPTKLQNLTTPLYVKRTSKNTLTTRMLPEWNDELSSCGPRSDFLEATERSCSALDTEGNLSAYSRDPDSEDYSGGPILHMIGNDLHNTLGVFDWDPSKRKILYMNNSGTELKMPLLYADLEQLQRPPLKSWQITVAAPAGVEPDVLAGLVRADNFPDPGADPMEEDVDYEGFGFGAKKTSSPSTKITYAPPLYGFESPETSRVSEQGSTFSNQTTTKKACFSPKKDASVGAAPAGNATYFAPAAVNTTHVRRPAAPDATFMRPPAPNATFMRPPASNATFRRPALNSTFAADKPAVTCAAQMVCGVGDLSGIEELEEDEGPCPGACDLVDDSYDDDAYMTAQDMSYGTEGSFMSAQGSFSSPGAYYGGGGGGGCGGGCRR